MTALNINANSPVTLLALVKHTNKLHMLNHPKAPSVLTRSHMGLRVPLSNPPVDMEMNETKIPSTGSDGPCSRFVIPSLQPWRFALLR